MTEWVTDTRYGRANQAKRKPILAALLLRRCSAILWVLVSHQRTCFHGGPHHLLWQGSITEGQVLGECKQMFLKSVKWTTKKSKRNQYKEEKWLRCWLNAFTMTSHDVLKIYGACQHNWPLFVIDIDITAILLSDDARRQLRYCGKAGNESYPTPSTACTCDIRLLNYAWKNANWLATADGHDYQPISSGRGATISTVVLMLLSNA